MDATLKELALLGTNFEFTLLGQESRQRDKSILVSRLTLEEDNEISKRQPFRKEMGR